MSDEFEPFKPMEWTDATPPEDWGDECASCPFCGSVEIRPWTDDETGNHMMWCYACGADGPPADNDADAEERWNRRVTPPAVVAALVEALEGMLDLDTRQEVINEPPEADDMRAAAQQALAAYQEAGR